MELFKIVKDSNPNLRKRCEQIDLPLSDNYKITLLNMVEYLKLSQDEDFLNLHPDVRSGVGLAAPQIGINKQMLAIYFKDENNVVHQFALVNPIIKSESVKRAYLAGGEGCLSVDKDHKGYVYRAYKVTVHAYDLLQNKTGDFVFTGYGAIVVQHEIDHLKGILFYDHINKKNPFEKIPNSISL